MKGPTSLFGLFSSRSVRPRHRLPKATGVEAGESLERRSMLAGDFVDGVLTLVGTESADVISLSVVKQNGAVVNGSVKVRGVAGVPKDTVFANVSSVVIQSLGGNDKVVVGSGLKNVSGGFLAVSVDAGSGKDVVTGGDGSDTILGGLGKDVLKGGKGDDSIDGGGDDDKVSGDDGDDVCLGGSGRDGVRGGKGKDSLYGDSGDDKVYGDDGDDDLDGGLGDDELVGGRGNDDDVDDDDSLRDMSRSGDDSGDNENEDEDENDDDDDDDGDFEDDEDEGEDDDGDDDNGGSPDDDDDPAGTVIAFSNGSSGTASLNGSSAGKADRIYYSFTIANPATLSVVMQNVDAGRYPDLEIERQGAGAEVEYELEPGEGGPTSGTFNLVAGTYSIRLRSPDLRAVSYAVDLVLTPMT
jgi:Ca2+-binding RTX toxin-like protein